MFKDKNSILKADYNIAENKQSFEQHLKDLKFFQKNDITYENLELTVKKISEKTNNKINVIMPFSDGTVTAFCVQSNDKTFQITGTTIKELLIKFIVYSRFDKKELNKEGDD